VMWLIAALLLCRSTVQAQGPLYSRAAERFGVAVRRELGQITDYDVRTLNIGWYSDWYASVNPPRPGGVEYAQLLWVTEGLISPPRAEIQTIVMANPGSLWLIGNEPECIHQGKNTPQQYAEAYHELHALIKGLDSSAQIAVGGVVQPTPLRLQWLDQVLQHYEDRYGTPMPVDVWNIHNMILQEVRGQWGCDIPVGLDEDSGRLYEIDDNDNVDIFIQHIVDFRQWMLARREREKPLIITEYGVLMPTDLGLSVARVNAFMDASFDYLISARDWQLGYPEDEDRLVQRWLWFSLNDQPWDPESGEGFNGALFDYPNMGYPGVLTEFGLNFQRYTRSLAEWQYSAYLPLVKRVLH